VTAATRKRTPKSKKATSPRTSELVAPFTCDDCGFETKDMPLFKEHRESCLGSSSYGRAQAYDEVLELLDAEIAKFKERDDLMTAETIEVMRAKVKARSEK
jgi:hypothetical protein